MLTDDFQQTVARGLRNGERDAWTALYDACSADVWRYVARLCGGDEQKVADVVQEVFLAAARAARSYDPARGSLTAWLLGIAHRQAALYWRSAERASRWRRLAESGAVEVRRWLDEGECPADWWARRELADLVRGVLAELPAEYAALLAGKYLDQRSLEELAETSAGSVEAVKSKLARARREFREQFVRRAGADRLAQQS